MATNSRAARALGTQLAEIGAAAPSVVGRRLSRMALAGTNLTRSDKRELALMSSEKLDAAWASWEAMSKHAMALNSAVVHSSMAFWMPWAFTAKAWPTAPDALMNLIGAGLRPYQVTVKANDRRLKKSGPRLSR
ncbi:MAG: hypothetical protein ABWY48_05415 [Pseudoxanthomonas sp.]